MIRWHDVHRRLCYSGSVQVIQVSYTATTYIVDCVIGVSSVHTGIIRWHDVHRRLCYWGQLSSYRYHTLARRTSLTVLLGSAQVIQVLYASWSCTSSTVLLGLAGVIQVRYAGTAHINYVLHELLHFLSGDTNKILLPVPYVVQCAYIL